VFFITDCKDAGQKDKGNKYPKQEAEIDERIYQWLKEHQPEQRNQHDQESVLIIKTDSFFE
jgi:pyrroloquinoline quinone (PQQ) biosynthesis protein C